MLNDEEINLAVKILAIIKCHTKLVILLARATYYNPLVQLEELTTAADNKDFENSRLNIMIELNLEERRVYEFIMLLFQPEFLNSLQQHYLYLLASLPSQDIPIYHLMMLFGIRDIDQMEFVESLNFLVKQGWLESADNFYYRLHPIVQMVVLKKLDFIDFKKLIIVIQLVSNIDDKIQILNFDDYSYLDYSEYIITNYNYESLNKEKIISRLCDIVGHVYLKVGFYNKALQCFLHGVSILENLNLVKDSNAASVYNNVGAVYRSLGEPKLAYKMSKKALDIAEEYDSKDKCKLINLYSNISIDCQNMHDYDQSMSYCKKALSVINSLKEEECTLDIARVYSNLAALHRKRNEYFIAMKYDNMAINIRENKLPANHLDLAFSYNNVAVNYRMFNNYEEALKCHLKAINIREKILPYNHPAIAGAYHNKAGTHLYFKQYKQAIDSCLTALSIWESADEPVYKHLVESYGLIIHYYCQIKEYIICKKYLQTTIILVKLHLGDNEYLIEELHTKLQEIEEYIKDEK